MGASDYLLEPLTQREGEILCLLAQGLSDREIAEKLVIGAVNVGAKLNVLTSFDPDLDSIGGVINEQPGFKKRV
jgi:DNA-binding NarL/FixJ family response regulator